MIVGASPNSGIGVMVGASPNLGRGVIVGGGVYLEIGVTVGRKPRWEVTSLLSGVGNASNIASASIQPMPTNVVNIAANTILIWTLYPEMLKRRVRCIGARRSLYG